MFDGYKSKNLSHQNVRRTKGNYLHALHEFTLLEVTSATVQMDGMMLRKLLYGMEETQKSRKRNVIEEEGCVFDRYKNVAGWLLMKMHDVIFSSTYF